MTKKQLLKLLEQVDDEVIVYVLTEVKLYRVQGIYCGIRTGDDVQNEITLVCY